MNLSPASITALTAASTPEEAAKVFYAEVSKGLTLLMADAISKAVSSASTAATSPSIAGWQDLVGGLVAKLDWQSPSVLKPAPMVQLACFAPYTGVTASNVHTMGGNVSIGISIGATF